jgi:hypothetical protein
VYLPYLPDNANNYPNLEDGYTDWTHYEQPEVNEIVFRYGSELHYQHLLKYNKAYINYNWGYYDGKFNNEQPSKSWENAKKLSRNTWYILAAPLKDGVGRFFPDRTSVLLAEKIPNNHTARRCD